MMNNFWLGNYWNFPNFLPFILPLVLVDIVLKAFALWRAAKRGEVYWFVAILFINSLGILPGFYLLWTQNKRSK